MCEVNGNGRRFAASEEFKFGCPLSIVGGDDVVKGNVSMTDISENAAASLDVV